MKQQTLIAIGVLFAVLIIIGGYSLYARSQSIPGPIDNVACTMDAQQCPDGSYVGRTGPNCAFAACPSTSALDTTGWKTTTQGNVTFKYPESLNTKYTRAQTWPPNVSFSSELYACPAGEDTSMITISGKTYCTQTVSEGAAGSTYTTYVMILEEDRGMTRAEAVIQRVQCGNYDDPEKSACEAERASFQFEPILAEVIQSVVSENECGPNPIRCMQGYLPLCRGGQWGCYAQ